MITVNCSCDTEQGHEDTMMGSHPGSRVTACSVRCSIFEYLMAMMAGDLTLGREGTSLGSGDQKYSENLGSTIEEHQPCHFRSTMIGGVTIPFTQKTAASERVVFTGVARYCTPERLREHAKEGTNAISYEPDVEKTLRRNTSSNRTEITHSLICFMVILA
ncbi:hypothetical protein IGI04_042297 [Brassica rapa subsp. trilocularis]|uniref:Uncharacterized protein n=1 Tax=Brassica rapa subsp. trilocularis TaxID=1813537 RepID=A0ABQ7KLJ5_BRACM|nr:hypothetical protein IGI04_042297 [Brassica rapa subsp. trilocularis]